MMIGNGVHDNWRLGNCRKGNEIRCQQRDSETRPMTDGHKMWHKVRILYCWWWTRKLKNVLTILPSNFLGSNKRNDVRVFGLWCRWQVFHWILVTVNGESAVITRSSSALVTAINESELTRRNGVEPQWYNYLQTMPKQEKQLRW